MKISHSNNYDGLLPARLVYEANGETPKLNTPEPTLEVGNEGPKVEGKKEAADRVSAAAATLSALEGSKPALPNFEAGSKLESSSQPVMLTPEEIAKAKEDAGADAQALLDELEGKGKKK
ncbi:MAG: hypothetical protein AAB606_05760 [Patescibacteria group bacterium]